MSVRFALGSKMVLHTDVILEAWLANALTRMMTLNVPVYNQEMEHIAEVRYTVIIHCRNCDQQAPKIERS
jgi:hypothetical protein